MRKSDIPPPYYVRFRQTVSGWPLKKWLSLTLGSFLFALIVLMANVFTAHRIGGMPQRVDDALAIVAALGFVTCAVSGLVSFIYAHAVVFRRERNHADRTTSLIVLAVSYGLILMIGGLIGWREDAPTYLRAIRYAPVAIGSLIGIWMLAPWFLGVPYNTYRAYIALPKTFDYIREYRRGDQANCRYCGSTRIHQYGLANGDDGRRVFKCMTCNRWLYRSQVG